MWKSVLLLACICCAVVQSHAFQFHESSSLDDMVTVAKYTLGPIGSQPQSSQSSQSLSQSSQSLSQSSESLSSELSLSDNDPSPSPSTVVAHIAIQPESLPCNCPSCPCPASPSPSPCGDETCEQAMRRAQEEKYANAVVENQHALAGVDEALRLLSLQYQNVIANERAVKVDLVTKQAHLAAISSPESILDINPGESSSYDEKDAKIRELTIELLNLKRQVQEEEEKSNMSSSSSSSSQSVHKPLRTDAQIIRNYKMHKTIDKMNEQANDFARQAEAKSTIDKAKSITDD